MSCSLLGSPDLAATPAVPAGSSPGLGTLPSWKYAHGRILGRPAARASTRSICSGGGVHYITVLQDCQHPCLVPWCCTCTHRGFPESPSQHTCPHTAPSIPKAEGEVRLGQPPAQVHMSTWWGGGCQARAPTLPRSTSHDNDPRVLLVHHCPEGSHCALQTALGGDVHVARSVTCLLRIAL